MGIIKKLLSGMSENKKELKEKFKEAQQNLKVQTMLEEREKSSNQRELEGYLKKEREKLISEQLEKIHKKQTRDNWKGESILKSQTNILKGDKKRSVLNGNKKMFNQKNIFLDNKTKIPLTGQEMFFKW